MRDSDESSQTRLIVFDTNVVESRYIGALLRRESVRDFAWLREHGCMPAVARKSVFEILYHVKKGEPALPWMDQTLGYPGGLEAGTQILRQIPELASRENLFWWFGLCEEWRGLDWEAERELVESLVRPGDKQSALRSVAVREELSAWKFRLTAFCDRIEEAINREMRILEEHLDRSNLRGVTLFDELSRSCLVPNEDLEILVAALMAEADAFVTADRDLLMQSGLSLSLNYKTSFVHPDQLRESVSEGFLVRWSHSQTHPRNGGTELAG
jgi:predicted nucleic acid-binding protein